MSNEDFLEFNEGGILFYPYTSVNLLKVQQLKLKKGSETEYDIPDFNSESSDKKKREKIDTRTVLFTSYSREKDMEMDQSELVRAYYFPIDANDNEVYIYRKTPNQQYYDLIAKVNGNEREVWDYSIVANNYYHYLVSSLVQQGASSTANKYYIYENKDDDGNLMFVQPFFNSWSIADIEEDIEDESLYKITGDVWMLGCNLQMQSFNQNVGINTWDTLGRYPRTSVGQKNYESGSFSGLLGNFKAYDKWANFRDVFQPDDEGNYKGNKFMIEEINQNLGPYMYNAPIQSICEYTEKYDLTNPYAVETEKLERWREFISNGNLKLIKDIKGNGWIVSIVPQSSYEIMYTSNIKQTQISFQWQEVENLKESSVIGLNE